MDWTGIQWYGMESSTIGYQVHDPAPSLAKRYGAPVVFTTIRATPTNYPDVGTMPKCAACGAELKLPVRTPHTVYVKTLYRVAGQDYCHHHIIRAVVAVSIIAEVNHNDGTPVARLIGERPRAGMVGPTSAEPVYAIAPTSPGRRWSL